MIWSSRHRIKKVINFTSQAWMQFLSLRHERMRSCHSESCLTEATCGTTLNRLYPSPSDPSADSPIFFPSDPLTLLYIQCPLFLQFLPIQSLPIRSLPTHLHTIPPSYEPFGGIDGCLLVEPPALVLVFIYQARL